MKIPDTEKNKKYRNILYQTSTVTALILMFFFLFFTGCTKGPESCEPIPYRVLLGADTFAVEQRYPFRFPLDDTSFDASLSYTMFCGNSSGPPASRMYHAAEDFFQPAGTPVYAMADGTLSFSGPMGGYGWLVIIDHPQANFYSLYGHISPSRYRMDPGPVNKGDLIGYLGDDFENGGSREHPLEPHLHLGIRAGQRNDYPIRGEWRWMAGWIKQCPTDLGWLQPSVIIMGQEIPAGGYPDPVKDFWALWGIEALIAFCYLIGGVGLLIFGIRKDKRFLLLLGGVVYCVGGWYFLHEGWKISPFMFGMGIILLAVGSIRLWRRFSLGRRS